MFSLGERKLSSTINLKEIKRCSDLHAKQKPHSKKIYDFFFLKNVLATKLRTFRFTTSICKYLFIFLKKVNIYDPFMLMHNKLDLMDN